MSFSSVSTDIKTKWDEELGTVISDETWVRALSCVNGTSSCACLNLIQFKVLHRTHYRKVRLAKIYPEIDETCDRCRATNADLDHMFWSWSKLGEFWKSIFGILNVAFGLDLQPSPLVAIFGVDAAIATGKKCFIAFATLIARRRILLEWKSQLPPKASMWLSDMMFLKIEKVKYFLRGSTKKLYKVWDPLLVYFDKLATLPSH